MGTSLATAAFGYFWMRPVVASRKALAEVGDETDDGDLEGEENMADTDENNTDDYGEEDWF